MSGGRVVDPDVELLYQVALGSGSDLMAYKCVYL
jgi:hypothetical protein